MVINCYRITADSVEGLDVSENVLGLWRQGKGSCRSCICH